MRGGVCYIPLYDDEVVRMVFLECCELLGGGSGESDNPRIERFEEDGRYSETNPSAHLSDRARVCLGLRGVP